MSDRCYELHGLRVIEMAPDGPTVRTERDAVTLIGDALGNRASMVLISVERLAEEFFDLRTRIAGEFLQKFVNYGLRLAIMGDISRRTTASSSLRDFVYEANRGDRIWFVADIGELHSRLSKK